MSRARSAKANLENYAERHLLLSKADSVPRPAKAGIQLKPR